MNHVTPERVLFILGLSLFFGLAFEEFYHASPTKPPGGIRTFPLLALLGAGLYVVEPANGIVLAGGFLALGGWLFGYYRARLGSSDGKTDDAGASLIVPACNALAFVLGPITLLGPPWFAVAVTVSAVVLLSARARLHEFASHVPGTEITTLGKFLVLTGIVLPLLPDTPVSTLSPITPYKAWLALVAVSGLSYASYLAQRYLPLRGSTLAVSILGGLYSSTATTALIARRLRKLESGNRSLEAGIVLATAVMYLRVGVVIAVFNVALAERIAPALAGLLVLGVVLSFVVARRPGAPPPAPAGEIAAVTNPLELSTAVIFAVSFVAISAAVAWTKAMLGTAGFFWLAAVVGVTDIDPFVLGVAQGGAVGIAVHVLVIAILIAASSNNVLKAIYALAFSRGHHTAWASLSLAILAAAGLGIAWWLQVGGIRGGA